MTMKDGRLDGLRQVDDFLINNWDWRGTGPAPKVA